MSNFSQRILMSAVGLIILFTTIYLSTTPPWHHLFLLVSGAAIGGALWEYYHIAQAKGCHPVSAVGLVGTFAYLYAVYYTSHQAVLSQLVFGLIFAASFFYYLFRRENPFLNIAVTVFGVVYLTLPLSFLVPMNFVFGSCWLLYLLFVTKMTDAGAYFFGKVFGQKKLSPTISPGKTWEGACGGVLFGVATSLLVALTCVDIPLFQAALWGGALSVVGQLGDLAESLLKRDVGVKDSSHLPGLGGMLDVVDSLVFTSPTLYFMLTLKV